MLGSGAIVIMDETTDVVQACWRIVRFFARESCGKCTPCREGTTWLERILRRIIAGEGRRVRRRSADGRLRQHQPRARRGRRSRRRSARSVRRPPHAASRRSVRRAFRSDFDQYLPTAEAGRCLRRRPRRRRLLSLTVDGRVISAEPGELLIAAAERHGVYIPRFCYHPRMTSVGMCRMCLVEVEGRAARRCRSRACSTRPRAWSCTPNRRGEEGAGRRPRVLADQPSARLPGLRQGRRVPAARPDHGVRARREPVRRGEASLREADPDQRSRLPRPRALHPLRSLHPLRQ